MDHQRLVDTEIILLGAEWYISLFKTRGFQLWFCHYELITSEDEFRAYAGSNDNLCCNIKGNAFMHYSLLQE